MIEHFIPGAPDAMKRYREDPAFRQITDVLRSVIGHDGLTSLDVRNAATLAAILWESENVRPILIGPIYPKPDGV